MALRINYNLAASVAQRSLGASQDIYARQAEKLATGLRINKAGDDAAGMAVSERLKNQVRGLNQAGRNALDAVSLIQTGEGALSETHQILGRMRELAVQAANDTVTASDRANLFTEFSQLAVEVDRIATATQFNGSALLNNAASVRSFRIGANQSTPNAMYIAANQFYSYNYIGSQASAAVGAANGGAVTVSVGGKTASLTLANSQSTSSVVAALNQAFVDAGIQDAVAELDSATRVILRANASIDISGTAATSLGAALGIDSAAESASVVSGNSAVLTAGFAGATVNLTFTAGQSVSQAVAAFNAQISAAGNATTYLSVDSDPLGQRFVIKVKDTSAGSLTLTSLANAASATSTLKAIGFNADSSSPSANVVGSTDTFEMFGFNSGSTALGVAALSITSQGLASNALNFVDTAINRVSSQRAYYGALQNRLESTSRSIAIASENAAAANSRIADADIAQSMSDLVRAQILQQAGISVLAQANQAPSLVLQLLK